MTVHGMHRQAWVDIEAAPAAVYALVADLPRMGEWSPENDGGEWQGEPTGGAGDRFVGHNRVGDREWSVLCEITVADPPKKYEWVTRPDIGPCVRWTYCFEPTKTGTRVTETWDVMQLPPSLVGRTQEQLDQRAEAVERGMVTTLHNMKAHLEA